MITITQLLDAQKEILKIVVDQVQNGQQSKDIEPSGMYACGQFLAQPDKHQRGVHGSAAALTIIASSSNPLKYRKLIIGLISYLKNRRSVDTTRTDRINRDEINVIKICEILYALSFVEPGVTDKNPFANELHSKLIQHIIDQKGWGYFIGPLEVTKLLPTGLAVLGLGANGFSTDGPMEVLETALKNNLKGPVNDPTQFAKYVFILYALVFKEEILSEADKKKYISYFKVLKKSPACNMNLPLEQSMEYWAKNDTDHEYIRVPWQLYFICMAAKIEPWTFSDIKTLKVLRAIVKDKMNGGFKYKHSGSHLSTRTQAIIFDTFSKIKLQLNRSFVFFTYHWIDRVLSAFRSLLFRRLVQLTVILVIIYSVITWINNDTNKWFDLASNLVAELFMALYLIANRRS